MSSAPKKGYFSNGELLETPPMTVRLSRFVESIYFFFGLYFSSLFALDSYAAAENSSFNVTHSRNKYTTRSRWGNSSSYGGGGGGGDGPGSGPRRVGRIDDFRGATDSSGPRCGGGCG
ncbi:unnamed protein product [Penicillium salamii]|uniref:Glycine-rich protein n=1 Tax=Penicillium salamii TaxID=1612424 RepID=A0A9W4J724_9EURO|nr:unnamed protein product [Penicillium salamii]